MIRSSLTFLLIALSSPVWAAPDAGLTDATASAAESDGSATTPDNISTGPPCREGNLIAGKSPYRRHKVKSVTRVTDNLVPAEGSNWKTAHSAILETSASYLIYDLGEDTRVRALMFQGDNNDTYQFSVSQNGRDFTPLWTVPEHPRSGMRIRLSQGLDAPARYLKLGGAKGDRSYSTGEIQAFCVQPAIWPPPVDVKTATAKKKKKDARKRRLARIKMAVGGIGLAVLLGLLLGPRMRDRPLIQASVIVTVPALLLFVAWATLHEHGWQAKKALDVGKSLGKPWTLVALGVALVGLIWAGIQIKRHLAEKPWTRSFERGILLALVFAGGMSWVNYGTFHGSRAIHYWDSFHYVIGGKYFSENRYGLIYHCSAVAELDEGRRGEFEDRQIRDLKNNALGEASQFLDNPGPCREVFTPARWEAYRQDLRLFRSYMGKDWWAKMFRDHGFNATPVWTMVGKTTANWGWEKWVPPPDLINSPANLKGKSKAERSAIHKRFQADRKTFERYIGTLGLIDGLLYVGIFAFILWAFGLRGLAFTIFVWGIGYPWAYYWTGGSFGRVPWLFMAVAGTCFMKKGFPLLGGFSVTWSMLLRIFPGALIGGVSAKIGWNIIRHRTITGPHIRLILGCVLALAVLVPTSLTVVDDFSAYKEFLDNSFKHKETPLTNHMGLPTLLSWSPSTVARYTRNNKLDDPFKLWKDKRKELRKNRLWLQGLLLLVFLGLLGFVGRKIEDWELTALSTILITGVFELTCYYFSYVILLALMGLRKARYMVALVAMSIMGSWLQLRVGWYDEQYIWESLVFLLAQAYILGDLAYGIWREEHPKDEDADPAALETEAESDDVESDAPDRENTPAPTPAG